MKRINSWTCLGMLLAGAALLACEDAPSGSDSQLRQFYTCGDPVCSSYRPQPGIAVCTTERVGAVCARAEATCDPADACNRLVVCAAEDPATTCPISRLRDKRDVQYLSATDLDQLHDDLLGFRLATYAYRTPGATESSHLGFLIDDVAPSPAVQGRSGDRVDLYGYTSMAVAALQTQARQLELLQKELEELKSMIACPCRDKRFP